MDLSNNEKRMLKALRSESDKTWNLDELLSACQWDDQVHVAGAGLALAEKGLVDISETNATVWNLGQEGETAQNDGLLERRLWDWLQSQPEDARSMKDLQSSGVASKQETGVGVGLLKGLGCEDMADCKCAEEDVRKPSHELWWYTRRTGLNLACKVPSPT
ncbi:MAG: hypothetical protein VYC11_00550 [Candidatus Thermoplasmatota archaeon]|nr:hypothetical protein [Candidatus Thermoplasmatota archaeon]